MNNCCTQKVRFGMGLHVDFKLELFFNQQLIWLKMRNQTKIKKRRARCVW